MIQTEKTNQTFVFIHDQDLLLEFEKNNKFKTLKNYTYVFLGSRDTSKLKDVKNLLVAKNFKKNLEDYPLFTAFTGWYMLWKNNLIKTNYVTFLEYDVVLKDFYEETISKLFYEDYDMIGYIPLKMNMYQYIKNPLWVEKLFLAIQKVHKIDMERTIKHEISIHPDIMWSSTNNITFKQEIFEEYMKWFEPLIDEIKDDKYCGHAQERAVSFFNTVKNKRISLTNGLLKHFQLNSHGTQTIKVNYEVSHNKLIFNQI
jgi:hypothetical protein